MSMQVSRAEFCRTVNAGSWKSIVAAVFLCLSSPGIFRGGIAPDSHSAQGTSRPFRNTYEVITGFARGAGCGPAAIRDFANGRCASSQTQPFVEKQCRIYCGSGTIQLRLSTSRGNCRVLSYSAFQVILKKDRTVGSTNGDPRLLPI